MAIYQIRPLRVETGQHPLSSAGPTWASTRVEVRGGPPAGFILAIDVGESLAVLVVHEGEESAVPSGIYFL